MPRFRQHTARRVGESINELETEFKEEEDDKLAASRFRELMDALDVEESTQELALAILKEEGMQAVQVQYDKCLRAVRGSLKNFGRRPCSSTVGGSVCVAVWQFLAYRIY